MSIKLQILIIVVIILAMLYIVNNVRKKSIDFKYALLWLFVCICVLVLAIFPKLLNVVAKAFGIASPVNMLFFLGFVFIILVIFSLTMSLSRNSERVRKMAQEIAIIRKDMYERYNGNNRENSGGN